MVRAPFLRIVLNIGIKERLFLIFHLRLKWPMISAVGRPPTSLLVAPLIAGREAACAVRLISSHHHFPVVCRCKESPLIAPSSHAA